MWTIISLRQKMAGDVSFPVDHDHLGGQDRQSPEESISGVVGCGEIHFCFLAKTQLSLLSSPRPEVETDKTTCKKEVIQFQNKPHRQVQTRNSQNEIGLPLARPQGDGIST